ncbi:MAG: acyl-CoA thioesterase [Clostridia bacterium]|nr:acyl-CoA thioesterase [Clostridia bacterium]
MSSDKTESLLVEHVRLTETDPYGIAHHSCYAVWAEMGLRALLDTSSAEKEPEIISFDCKYLKSAMAGDEIRIITRPSGADGYRFEILRDQTVLARGSLAIRKGESA